MNIALLNEFLCKERHVPTSEWSVLHVQALYRALGGVPGSKVCPAVGCVGVAVWLAGCV